MDNEFQQRSWRLRNAMASTYMAHCMYVRAWTLLPLPSDRDIAEGSEVIGNATAGEGHDDCPGPSSDKITEPHDLYETWGSAFSTPGTPYPRPHRTPCSNCDQNLHPEGRYQATILFRHRRRPNVDTDASATLMTLDSLSRGECHLLLIKCEIGQPHPQQSESTQAFSGYLPLRWFLVALRHCPHSYARCLLPSSRVNGPGFNHRPTPASRVSAVPASTQPEHNRPGC